ncbi:MAG: sugar phosphate nucleotidyltransferase [Defluviitaleaceae bacterium]|nr:sugar phosphate nucleotidyltransferase [Defluviitaleaceae bacterium]
MKKPVLVIMAAGLGSRYGGLKQIDPVGPNGEIIIDYSLYDAARAGFEQVIFVIKEENKQQFEETVGKRASKLLDVKYAFQSLDDIPKGCKIPENRIKPWGTTHAVLSAKNLIDGSFAAINADDYYGTHSFVLLHEFLESPIGKDNMMPFTMIGYELGNTLTDFGSVARGVCSVDGNGFLTEINERTNILKEGSSAFYTDNEGTKKMLDINSAVSMNMWGFTKDFISEAEKGFKQFFDKALPQNPEKAEYYLPLVVNDLINSGDASVKVLKTEDKWYGVTYKEDKPSVSASLKKLHDIGVYPDLIN